MDQLLTYMDYHWIQADDEDFITVGITEESLESFDTIVSANLPSDSEAVTQDESCGELDTDQGPWNLYSPCDGIITEVNSAAIENPKIIIEDPYGDGWLYRIHCEDPSQLSQISKENEDEGLLEEEE